MPTKYLVMCDDEGSLDRQFDFETYLTDVQLDAPQGEMNLD